MKGNEDGTAVSTMYHSERTSGAQIYRGPRGLVFVRGVEVSSAAADETRR
jgi:hypothetical protein